MRREKLDYRHGRFITSYQNNDTVHAMMPTFLVLCKDLLVSFEKVLYSTSKKHVLTDLQTTEYTSWLCKRVYIAYFKLQNVTCIKTDIVTI